MFKKRFERQLSLKHQAGLYREPLPISRREGKYVFIGGRKVLNLSSNDYLGLGASQKLREKVCRNFLKYGTSSSSSRLVCGNYSIISQAEKEYAHYFGYEDALFFPSGYQANIGVISTLFAKGDTILYDKHVHASSVKGMLLSGANILGYNHNRLSHLEKRLAKNSHNQISVLTESLFSMDGDLLKVSDLAGLKKHYTFLAIVDEAHAFGVIGENGKGIARDVADVATGTFGKALGLFGAFVLLPRLFKEYLLNFSSPLIYSTALPEAHAASAIDLLEIISQSKQRRKELKGVSLFMKESVKKEGFKVSGDAHILAVEIGNENRALAVSNKLLEKDIFVFTARYPTVPLGKAILRISMSALHDENDARHFVRTLKEVLKQF